ncbi:MAG TPA: DNA-3-methyladenine glycosylase [Terriglobales bacterium]|nr:DNA-3-methyladenine glycosylase [Terriglobales bacterium]
MKKTGTRRMRLLPRAFYTRDPRRVARNLLGKLLVRRRGRKRLAGRIVEAEAYLGKGDAAAHAAVGLTERNRVLFGPPGHAYVYFIYGNHYCLNVSCLPAGEAGCVLIRALEPVTGVEEMSQARRIPPGRSLQQLASGPGRLCEALGVTRVRDNGKDLASRRSDLVLCDDGFRPRRVTVTRRIGIRKSAEMPLRYVIAGNAFVSRERKLDRRKGKER